jgi:hypothetical protein
MAETIDYGEDITIEELDLNLRKLKIEKALAPIIKIYNFQIWQHFTKE